MRALLLILVSFVLVSCNSSSSDSPADSPAPGDAQKTGDVTGLGGTAKFKVAVLKLLEGNYGQNCLSKEKGAIQTSAGSAISVAGTSINWGGGGHDLTQVVTNEFSLSVSQTDSMVASGFDIVNPSTGDRIAIYGVQVSTSGYSSATVTSNEKPKEISNWCTGSNQPAAVGTSLWKLARQFININEQNLDCVDSKDQSSFKGTALFNDQEAKIQNTTFKRNSSTLEHISVNDTKTSLPIGLSFSAYDNSNSQLVVAIDTSQKLHSIQITRSDLTTISCINH